MIAPEDWPTDVPWIFDVSWNSRPISYELFINGGRSHNFEIFMAATLIEILTHLFGNVCDSGTRASFPINVAFFTGAIQILQMILLGNHNDSAHLRATSSRWTISGWFYEYVSRPKTFSTNYIRLYKPRRSPGMDHYNRLERSPNFQQIFFSFWPQ